MQAPAEISRVCDSLELKSQGVRSYLTWVLGPELRTSQEKQRLPPTEPSLQPHMQHVFNVSIKK